MNLLNFVKLLLDKVHSKPIHITTEKATSQGIELRSKRRRKDEHNMRVVERTGKRSWKA